jgi:Ser/Thr protein kinase RdoA (MazF antagonist)
MNDGLSLTTCHGDCHGSNARIVKSKSGGEEAAFFDFDEGGFGYLSYDLAVYLWANAALGPKMYELWHGFIEGYRAVRPIAPADLEAMRLFVPIRHIWLMGGYASRVFEWGSEALPASWLNRQADFLREWETEKLSPALF